LGLQDSKVFDFTERETARGLNQRWSACLDKRG
jgi:hypothetical protein